MKTALVPVKFIAGATANALVQGMRLLQGAAGSKKPPCP